MVYLEKSYLVLLALMVMIFIEQGSAGYDSDNAKNEAQDSASAVTQETIESAKNFGEVSGCSKYTLFLLRNFANIYMKGHKAKVMPKKNDVDFLKWAMIYASEKKIKSAYDKYIEEKQVLPEKDDPKNVIVHIKESQTDITIIEFEEKSKNKRNDVDDEDYVDYEDAEDNKNNNGNEDDEDDEDDKDDEEDDDDEDDEVRDTEAGAVLVKEMSVNIPERNYLLEFFGFIYKTAIYEIDLTTVHDMSTFCFTNHNEYDISCFETLKLLQIPYNNIKEDDIKTKKKLIKHLFYEISNDNLTESFLFRTDNPIIVQNKLNPPQQFFIYNIKFIQNYFDYVIDKLEFHQYKLFKTFCEETFPEPIETELEE